MVEQTVTLDNKGGHTQLHIVKAHPVSQVLWLWLDFFRGQWTCLNNHFWTPGLLYWKLTICVDRLLTKLTDYIICVSFGAQKLDTVKYWDFHRQQSLEKVIQSIWFVGTLFKKQMCNILKIWYFGGHAQIVNIVYWIFILPMKVDI